MENENTVMVETNTSKKKIAIVASIIGVIAVVAIIVLVISNSKVSATKYLKDELVISGSNGYGSVSKDVYDIIDLDKLYYDMTSQSINSEDENAAQSDLDSAYGSWFDALTFEDSFSVSFEGKENGTLKNGDEITVVLNINVQAINALSVVKKPLKEETVIKKTYKIDSLLEPQKIDPFDAVKGVSKDSTNNNNYVIIYNTAYEKTINNINLAFSNDCIVISTNDDIYKIAFKVLSDGSDNVVVTIDDSITSSDSELNEAGLLLSKKEQTYKSSTCKKLIDYKKITKEDYNCIKAMADARIDDYKDKTIEFVKAYFGSEENEFFGDQNKISFVYKYVDQQNGETKYMPLEATVYITSDNIVFTSGIGYYVPSYNTQDDYLNYLKNDGYSVHSIDL